MLRRNFLGFLGVLPFGFSKTKENPKNLPIIKFAISDEYPPKERMANHKEILGNKDEVLVWVNKEDLVMRETFLACFGEMVLVKAPGVFYLKQTSNTNLIRLKTSYGWK